MSKKESKTEFKKTPQHIAIIMDGNGRWAKARGLPRVAGHRAGAESLRRVLRAAVDFGVKILTVYAFSTENWKRPAQEVNALLGLFERAIDNELDELRDAGVSFRHIGRTQGLPARLLDKIGHAQEATQDNERLILNIAFNYGGRAEIVDAVRKIVAEGIPVEQIDDRAIAQHLYTGGLPDPDLIIRTGGDMRTSNFLIWQSAYAELYVTPVFWPDFDGDDLRKALVAFQGRERRFGGLKKPT